MTRPVARHLSASGYQYRRIQGDRLPAAALRSQWRMRLPTPLATPQAVAHRRSRRMLRRAVRAEA